MELPDSLIETKEFWYSYWVISISLYLKSLLPLPTTDNSNKFANTLYELLSDREKRMLDGDYGAGNQKTISFPKMLGESSGVEAAWDYINSRKFQIP